MVVLIFLNDFLQALQTVLQKQLPNVDPAFADKSFDGKCNLGRKASKSFISAHSSRILNFAAMIVKL